MGCLVAIIILGFLFVMFTLFAGSTMTGLGIPVPLAIIICAILFVAILSNEGKKK